MAPTAGPATSFRVPDGTHILLVEDDGMIRRTVRIALERYGFTVSSAGDGFAGLELFQEKPCDLLLLDVMLPGLDGIGLCRRIRETSTVPILMMSARGDDLDVISGLEVGADDYVVKPCDSAMLVARIRSLLRRASFPPLPPPHYGEPERTDAREGAEGAEETEGAQEARGTQPGPAPDVAQFGPAPDVAQPGPAPEEESGAGAADPAHGSDSDERTFGDLTVDTRGLEVRRSGETVALTPTELRLLLAFVASPGAVLERDTLLRQVWDHAWHSDTRVVDLHVQRLRGKIGAERIETVRGFGYKLRP